MKSANGFPGATDPAYAHELAELGARCRTFLTALEDDDFDACLFAVGVLVAQCAAVYKLSPPAGVLNPAELFKREDAP